jgi:hypothetical protein
MDVDRDLLGLMNLVGVARRACWYEPHRPGCNRNAVSNGTIIPAAKMESNTRHGVQGEAYLNQV